MYRGLKEITRQKSTAERLEICAELGIPITPIHALDELPEHPHLQAAALSGTTQHPAARPIRDANPPVKFPATPANAPFHAPVPGRHTMEVLREFGYDEQETSALKARWIMAEKHVS